MEKRAQERIGGGNRIEVCLTALVSIFLLVYCEALASADQVNVAGRYELPLLSSERSTGANKFSDSLSYGYKLTIENSVEENYDLDPYEADKYDLFTTELEIGFLYKPSQKWDIYFDLELVSEAGLVDTADKHNNDNEINIKELNATYYGALCNCALKAGRQEYKDEREWLYDEELDAIRLFYRSGKLGWDLSISGDQLFERDLTDNDERKDIYNMFLTAEYLVDKDSKYVTYLFVRNNHEEGERLRWLGFRAIGEIDQGSQYWLESAYLTGKSRISTFGRQRKIEAYGFDLGGTLVSDSKLKPSISLGWAFGSGDNDSDSGRDRYFRQTGLQDNNGNLNSFTRFKYYGEVIEPELSNLSIFTAGIGFHPYTKTSINLVYHDYRQHEKSKKLRDSNLELEPLGVNRDIGKEVDLIVGFRGIEDLYLEFVYGRFRPGAAFGVGLEKAQYINFKLKYKF